jgi:putative tRNA adenosine deaminase-associated protein
MIDQLDMDFAFAAFCQDGDWNLEDITDPVLVSVEKLATGLRRFPGNTGSLALIGLDEDVFMIVRVVGSETKVLLSDITAADEWDLARSAVEHLQLPYPEEDDDSVPAGDLDILSDLGLSAIDLAVLIDDYDLYPDELLSEVAARLGFGPVFDDAAGLTSA